MTNMQTASIAQEPGKERSTLTTLLWLGLMFGLALLGLQYSWLPQTQRQAPTAPDGEPLPDSLVTGARLDSYDDQGLRVRQLSGEKILFFDGEKRSEITRPVATITRKNPAQGEPWLVTADHATIYNDTSVIDLQGNVAISSSDPANGRTSIHTEQLSLDTDKQFARTDKTVNIRTRNSEATASGLQADLTNERLVLPSRVRETHVVRH